MLLPLKKEQQFICPALDLLTPARLAIAQSLAVLADDFANCPDLFAVIQGNEEPLTRPDQYFEILLSWGVESPRRI